MLLLLRQLVFYREILVFLQLTEMAYMEQNEPFSTLNILFCRKYFFQNLTIFTKVNNMVDASASNSNGILSRDTCVSSTELNRPICNKVSLSPPHRTKVAGSIPFKTRLSFSTETVC
jgi:hypothetical protein